jgi:ribosomal protein L37E
MFKQQSPAVEVYCPRCSVSFPVGTRTCLHCGGRISRERSPRQVIAPPPLEEQLASEELPQRSGISPVTAFWVLLAMGGALYRACN